MTKVSVVNIVKSKTIAQSKLDDKKDQVISNASLYKETLSLETILNDMSQLKTVRDIRTFVDLCNTAKQMNAENVLKDVLKELHTKMRRNENDLHWQYCAEQLHPDLKSVFMSLSNWRVSELSTILKYPKIKDRQKKWFSFQLKNRKWVPSPSILSMLPFIQSEIIVEEEDDIGLFELLSEHLSNVTKLYIDNNETILSSLHKMKVWKSLKSLHICFEYLNEYASVSMALTHLNQLESLTVIGCKGEGIEFHHIDQFLNAIASLRGTLKYLCLEDFWTCHLFSNFRVALKQFANVLALLTLLEELHLDDNYFGAYKSANVLWPSLKHLDSLRCLSLKGNFLGGKTLHFESLLQHHLPSLEELHFDFSVEEDSEPSYLDNRSPTDEEDLDINNVSLNRFWNTLGTKTKLRHLTIEGFYEMTPEMFCFDAMFQCLSQLNLLESLNFDCIPLENVMADVCKVLPRLSQLRSLNLYNCEISKSSKLLFESLASLKELNHLSLRKNPIFEENETVIKCLCDALVGMEKLETLSLAKTEMCPCKCSLSFLKESVAQHSNFKSLDLSENNFDDSLLKDFILDHGIVKL